MDLNFLKMKPVENGNIMVSLPSKKDQNNAINKLNKKPRVWRGNKNKTTKIDDSKRPNGYYKWDRIYSTSQKTKSRVVGIGQRIKFP